MMLCVCIKCHKNALNGFKLQGGQDFVMDRHSYGLMGGQNTVKKTVPPHQQGRDIIPNKYISRVYCVHFHLLTLDTFPVYFVHPPALTSYTELKSLRVYCYILCVY